jgi:hypothetical protein
LLLEREGILIVQLKHPIDFEKKITNEFTNSIRKQKKILKLPKNNSILVTLIIKQQKIQFFKQEEMSLLMIPKQELVKIINIVNQYSIFNINISLKKQTY